MRIRDPSIFLLVRALQKAIDNELSVEEMQRISAIENLRSSLSHSSQEVSFLNYSVHHPGDDTPDEQLARGRVLRKQMRELANRSSQPYFASLVQFQLIRAFQPTSCLELGTSLGLSGAYMAAALRLNGEGQLITLEGAPSLAAMARSHYHQLDLTNVDIVLGPFHDTLDGVIEAHKPFGFVSKDALHTEAATVGFLERISPHLAGPAVLILDDINWSHQMRSAWQRIWPEQRVRISLDMRRTGICLFDDSIQVKRHIRLPVVGEWLAYRSCSQ
jgi:predicted O-methyltransferase YrrM